MKRSSTPLILLAVAICAFTNVPDSNLANAQEELFSGPQVGEKLSPFQVRGIFDEDAGKDIDFVGQAGDRPIVLIFVHDVNRQSVSMIRVLSGYTVGRSQDGLVTGIVWLDDDATAAENQLKTIRHALTPGAPTGVYLEGREGPGNYGLNRNATLTILVGKQGKATGNFALVQPSLQVDLPKILQSVVDVAGGEVPALDDLPGMPMMDRNPSAQTGKLNLRPLLAPLIRRDAGDADVDKAAKDVEGQAAEDPAVHREVGRIAKAIVDAGKLEHYGTARAQEYLQKWAKEFVQESDATKLESR